MFSFYFRRFLSLYYQSVIQYLKAILLLMVDTNFLSSFCWVFPFFLFLILLYFSSTNPYNFPWFIYATVSSGIFIRVKYNFGYFLYKIIISPGVLFTCFSLYILVFLAGRSYIPVS